MESLLQLDENLFFLINHLPHNDILDWSAFIVDVLVGYGILFIIAFLVVFLFERGKFLEYLILGSISLFSTILLCSVILKNIFQRARPVDSLGDVIHIGNSIDPYSMPSGHTAAIFSFFMVSLLVLGFKDRVSRIVVSVTGLMAILTGFGRVYVGHHYPSDVIVGAALGMLISATIYYVVSVIMRRAYEDETESHD